MLICHAALERYNASNALDTEEAKISYNAHGGVLDGGKGFMKTIGIIGGGASGLFSAIIAALHGGKVTIFEKMPRVGKKLLATGSGRCNFSNRNAGDVTHYHGGDRELIRTVLERFPLEQTLSFFHDLGIVEKEGEDGRLYPYSLQAASVLDALRFECEKLSVDIRCDSAVESIEKSKNGFVVTACGQRASFDRVIVCAGGKASASLGSDGSGLKLLSSLGLKTTPLYPTLVQVRSDSPSLRALKGLRVFARLSLHDGKSLLSCKQGELLFTDFGLSGPPALHVSRQVASCAEVSNLSLLVDFLPDFTLDEVRVMFSKRCSNQPQRNLEDFFLGLLHKRIGQALIKSADLPLHGLCGDLDAMSLDRLIKTTKAFRINPTGTLSFSDAQATAGGASLYDFKKDTLESKKVKGLFACGEVLDVDGDCGGFNLQWAWSSGYVAGLHSAKEDLTE